MLVSHVGGWTEWEWEWSGEENVWACRDRDGQLAIIRQAGCRQGVGAGAGAGGGPQRFRFLVYLAGVVFTFCISLIHSFTHSRAKTLMHPS